SRFNLLSLVYLIFLLLLPWFSSPNKYSLRGHTGCFLRAVLCTSLLFVLAHVCFQAVLYTFPPLSEALGDNCSQWDTISRHIGLSRLPVNDPWNMLRLLCPDVIVCGVSMVTVILCSRLVRDREMVAAANIIMVRFCFSKSNKFHVCLLFPGITLPSGFSAFYFLFFLGVCTWWACHLPISQLGFSALCVMVGFFAAGHIVCLYLYQSLLAQALFPPHSLWARLFGLKDFIVPGNCSLPDELILNTNHDWPVYVNPGILLLLYVTVVAVLRSGNCRPAVGRTPAADPSGLQECLWRTAYPLHQSLDQDTLSDPAVLPRRPQRVQGSHPRDPSPLKQQGGPEAPVLKPCPRSRGRRALDTVWSITYHSWLTFVLLLWACLIWILRARRHAATLCSPFILLYGLVLCCLQYIWAMELHPELPTSVGTMSLRQLGLDKAQYPCLRLGAMLLFVLTFWLLLRQAVMENFKRKSSSQTPLQEVATKGQNTHTHQSMLKVVGGMVMSCYAKYWIYVCGGMFVMVSFAGKLVAYKIVYMLLFLLCLCFYQVYYSLWRHLLKLFWWLVVAYTMLVLITIYTYQFEDFPVYWKNLTGFTDEQLAAIGLETFDLSELFTSILIPGFFLLACILQLHYFHKPFMRITDLENVTPTHKRRNSDAVGSADAVELNTKEDPSNTEESADEGRTQKTSSLSFLIPSKWGLVMDRLLVLSRKFSEILSKVQVFLWRLLELHILKMVAFFTVWVALQEASVMNLVLVVLWSLATPFCRFRPMASCLSTVWVCVIIICKMLYQLSVVNPEEYSRNCSTPLTNHTKLLLNSSLYKEPVDPAKWFGIRKDATALGYSKNHLIVLMLLVFEATVYRHQAHHYRQLQRSPPPIPAVFPSATRDSLDQGLVACLKYLVNYTFYKFGLEICFLMTVNVIGQRMNFLVLIHGCWMVAMLVRRRRAAIARIWPKYCLFLSIFMIYQYLLCVGIPPVLCMDYPWRWSNPVLQDWGTLDALIKWLYLPDFFTVPNSGNLMADFVLLMCASQQWKVFDCERTEEWMVLAGENSDEPEPMEGRLFNPAPNFINCRSYLDMLKVLVFRYFFWFVLSVVFITGASRISVFGLGYLLGCFFFLLFGTKLMVKRSRTRLILWDCLIIYNVAVIISKSVLSILACVFVFKMQERFCWVIQLFSLVCTVKGYYDRDDTCTLPIEEAGILWDGFCFICLLLQRRVFLSFYFLHVSTELQASAKQASRGFELFRASMMKNMDFHKQLVEILADAPETWKQETQTFLSCCVAVIHSGEYYLFESDSEDEEDLSSEEKRPRRLTASQVRPCSAMFCSRSKMQALHEHVFPIHGEMLQKILDVLRLLWAIILALVDGLTDWLNLLTKQYRETSTVLCNERYLITHKIQQVRAVRDSLLSSGVCSDIMKMSSSSFGSRSNLLNEVTRPSGSSGLQPNMFTAHRRPELILREFFESQNRLLKLLLALYSLLSAHSELLCYLIIVLNNVVSASVISVVLPILVFLWAMLALPRPSKRFWMTAIVYTEVMVVLKYIFQFGFFSWNSAHEMTVNKDRPFFPPRILGLEKTDNYLRYDLLQLLALFFHRALLMVYGPPEKPSLPSKEGNSAVADGRSGEEARSSVSSPTDVPVPEVSCKQRRWGSFGFYDGSVRRVRSVSEPAQNFFKNLMQNKHQASTDVYALMFLTDMVDFVIIIFGFWAFGKHSAAADIASTLSEDQVPEAFLVMLLIHFSTMIIDRALYLRKAVLGKLIFQGILVLGIHVWMFFILPSVTERKFNQNFVAQLWYFVKCIYFGLSAYQIRCGYPTRILGNFLTKNFSHLNLFLFQGFRLVPFLVELRAVMDWVWTDTTLSLSNWMCVEDIYANIFIIKCSRETEKKYPQPKGQKKKKIVKYGMGGLIVFFLICIIWFPLLFISLVRSVVGVVNHPIDVTVTVKLGGYEPLFTMSVQQQSIQPFNNSQYEELTKMFKDNATAMQFITLYSYEDIVTAQIEGSSGSVWRISPPSRQEVIKELLGSQVDLTLRLAWNFQRDLGKGGTVEHTFDKYSIDLEPGNLVRAELASLLIGNRTEPVLVPNFFPNYIRAPNGAEAKPVSQLYKGGEDGYLGITLSLKSDRSSNSSGTREWWDIAVEGCVPPSCGVLRMVIFNDKVSPPSLGFLAGYGIMGLYVSVVLVIGKFVRGFFSEISHSIMFEELPCVDRILKLCTDIFLVRETGELELEEELYSKLIFLYRSPETMIKWTRENRAGNRD
uniref:Piezo-type mechanosensitive ion channel component 1 n=1 Tax=Oryzias latipes TaxID=8090 RepID=A0A3P9K8U7_ORYLA